MQAVQIKELVTNFDTYPQWQEAIEVAEEVRAQRPPKDENNPTWLRAQAEMMEAQAAIAPATESLKVEVVGAGNELTLPFQIGLLRALDRNIGLRKKSPRHWLVDAVNMRFPGRSLDLDIKDHAFSSSDPFRYAADIGNAISEVEAALPRFRPVVQAAVLSIGNNHKGIAYIQPTEVDYYKVIVPQNRQICEQPFVSEEEGARVIYKLPRLLVIPAMYDERQRKIVASELPTLHSSMSSTIEIPRIKMLESDSRHIYPIKLLLGNEAVKFAVKHQKDVEEERIAARKRAESRDHLSRMRF